MRIALVVPGGVERDGEYRVIPRVLWLMERLARRHDVHVVVPRQEPEPGSWRLRGATVHNVGRSPLRLRAVATLRRLDRDRPFDVIHALWARGAGEVALAAGRLCGRPVLVHVAGGELVWLRDIRFGSRWPWRRALARQVLRSADRVSAASEPMLELIRSAGVEARRVPQGPDLSLWSPEPPRPRRPDAPARLVHVGSITPVKDHPTLLRALASLLRDGRAVHLDVVGVDAWDGRMHALAAERGLADHVTFHGFLPQARAAPVVRAADLMVVSSRHEAGPVAMLEAAAVGVPTVGTAVGHVREWSPAAASAVPIGDAAALAAAVAALLDDDDRRLALARSAQARARAEDAERTAAMFEDLYHEVVDGRN